MNWKKEVNKISKTRTLVFISVLLYLVLTLSSVFAYVPGLNIFENGTLDSNKFTGNLSTVPIGYNLSGFTIDLANFSFVQHTIPEYNSAQTSFVVNHTNKSNYFNESISYGFDWDKIIQKINTTSSWENEINLTVIKQMPSNCEFITVSKNGNPVSYSYNNATKVVTYNYSQNYSTVIDIECQSSFGSTINFEKNNYTIKTSEIFSDPITFINVKSYIVAQKHKREDSFTWNNGYLWDIHFKIYNEDDLDINISKIHVWASNTTTDYTGWSPDKNYLYDANVTCVDSILSKDEYCEHNNTFTSMQTPVVWADVDYTVDFNISGIGQYFKQTNPSSTSITGIFVGLYEPTNDSYIDTDNPVNFTFLVTANSNCTLYSNFTGIWQANESLTNVNGYTNITVYGISTGKYVWNVYCINASDISKTDWGNENLTVRANAIPRFSGPIPTITWNEDIINQSLNLSDYFIDPEGDDINWTFQPNPVNDISIQIYNNTGNVTLIPDLDFFGTRTITFTGIDWLGRTVSSNLVILNVTQVWDPPILEYWEVYNQTFMYNSTAGNTNITGEEDSSIRFNVTASDPDNTLLNFFWFLNQGLGWMLQQSDIGVLNSIWDFVTGFFDAGDYQVRLVVNSSEDSYNVTQDWNVTIENVNRAPPTPTLLSPTNSATVEDFGVCLNWTSVTDPDDPINGGTSEDFYNITYYIFHSDIASPTYLNKTTSTSYCITSQTFEKTYYWYVIASDNKTNATKTATWSYYYKEPQMSGEKNRVFYEDATPINITLDAQVSGLTLTADFSCMDSNYNLGDEVVTDFGNGMYSVYYWITNTNTVANTRCEINISSDDGRYFLTNISLKNGYWEAFYVGRANDCAGGLPTSNYFEEGGMCPTIPYKVDTSFAFGKFAGLSAEKLCNNGAADEYDPSGASATDTDGGDCSDYDCASIVYGEPIGAKASRFTWTCANGTNGWRDDPPWQSSGFTCYDSINLCSGGSDTSPTGTTNWIYTKVVKPGGYFAIRFHQDNLASDPDVSGGLYLNVNSFDSAIGITDANFYVINRSTYFGGSNSGLMPQQGLVTTASMIRAQTDDGSGTMTDYTGDDLDIIFRLYIPPATTASGLQQVKVTRYFPTAASKDFGIEFTIDNSGMDTEDDISCSDNEDNDLDYMYDCRDYDCENKTGNSGDVNDLCRFGNESKYASVTNDCMDSFDNDRDAPGTQYGAADCRWNNYDTDCNQTTILDSSWDLNDIVGMYGGLTTGVCELVHETTCNDGFDNDRDRSYDCYAKEISTGITYDSYIDYNSDPTNPLCTVANPDSLNTNNHPDAEYDCGTYCRTNVFATESSVGLKGCLDGKDNDIDFFNTGACSTNASGGVDCRMREYDSDCNGQSMQENDGDIGTCEIRNELTCNDDVDNDRDGLTDCNALDSGADGIPEYRFLADMDADYDCRGKCVNDEENTGVECRDNIDNDLDYWTITGWASNQYTATNNGYSGGLDCRYNYDGNHYPDSDCDGVAVSDLSSNSGSCQLENELTCNDGMDNDIDENNNAGGDRRININGADCDDYDCGGNAVCPVSEGAIGGSCLDGIDNDLDRYNRGHTAYQLDASRGTNNSGGIDCIYNFDGIRPATLSYLAVAYDNYLSDSDCDGTIIGGSGELCELYEEDNCTDNFDNDQDQYISTSNIHRTGWASHLDLTRSTTYNTAADCDDYSCKGKAGCPTDEDAGLCLAGNCGPTRNWCLDGIDNDLDDYDFRGYNIDNTVGIGVDCAWDNWDSDCNGALFNDTNGDSKVGTCEIRKELTCNDGVDNDQDRAIFKLAGSEVGSETAGYGTGIDCDDYDCFNNSACPTHENASTCGDGIDNDLDMFYWDGGSYQRNMSTGADCADPDCQGLPGPGGMLCAQKEEGDLICGDYDAGFFSQDNDGNGPANCYDGGCYHKGTCRICPSEENISIDSCADGLDNELTYTWVDLDHLLYNPANLNGSIVSDGTDCGDADCSGYFDGSKICSATETSCNDGFDNDRDGDIDCDDSECSGNIACPSYPTNTITACAAGTDCTKDGYINSNTQNLPRLTTVNGFGSTTTRFIYSRHVRVGTNATFRFTNTNQALIAGKPANMLVGTSGAGNSIPAAWDIVEELCYDTGTDSSLYTPVKVSTGVQLAYTPYPAATDLDMTLHTTINHTDAAATPLSYTFAVAHDIGGEMNTGTAITVYVYEDEPPNATWAYPPEDFVFRRIRTTNTLHVRANAFDNDAGHTFNSGIDYCQFYNGVSWVNEDSISAAGKGNCRHELSISDGDSISIGARAYDGVDNLGNEVYRNISVRTVPRQVSDFQCYDGVDCGLDYPVRKWYNKSEMFPVLIRFTSDVQGFTNNPTGCQVFFATDDAVYDMGNISLVSYSGTYGRCEGEINLSNTPIAAQPASNYAVYVKVKDDADEVGYTGISPFRDTYDMNNVWICNWVQTVAGKWSCLAPCDANTAPVIDAILDILLGEDEVPPYNWTDLWNYTVDNEQWDSELTYTLESQTNTSLINCSLVYNRYINCTAPAPEQVGTTTITVKVYDGFESDTDDYIITVYPVNDAPRLILNISNKTIIEDTIDSSTDLDNHFMDIEGDDINWTVNTTLSYVDNLTITINNNTGILTIIPDLDFTGIRWLTINAIDIYGAFNISNNITINVTPANDAPYFNDTISNLTFNEDTYFDTLNLTKYSHDVDNLITELNWTVNTTLSNINNLVIDIDNNTGIVNITPDLNFFGIRWVFFNVIDPDFAHNVSNNITINVTPVNDAPYFNDTISNITFSEDTIFNSLNLTNFTYDVDGDDLNWSIVFGSSNIINLTIEINNDTGILNITPDLDFVGIRWITLNVSDTIHAFNISNNITINITPVNDAPILNDTINNITFNEDTYYDSLNLTKYYFDIDGDNINWSINLTLSNIINLVIDIDNNTGIVNITPDLNFFGIRWMSINGYDPDNLFATSNNITINVTPVNDAPYFNDTINNITFIEDSIYSLLNLTNFTYDVDDLDLNWSVNYSLSFITNLTIGIDNSTGIVTITPDSNFSGIRFVTFVVRDSYNLTNNSNNITINVTSVNDAPILNDTINNITFNEDTYFDTLNLTKYYFDIDGDDINWSVNLTLSNTNNLTITIDNATGIVNISPDLNFYGIRWISINGYDPDNLFATSNNITINVTPVNDVPYFNDTINNMTFPEDTVFNSLNLNIYSYDVDDLDLNWTINTSLSVLTNLTVIINNNTGIVTITPDNNFTGLRLITFNVYDVQGLFNTSNIITINVTPVNDRPIFTNILPNITFIEDTYNDTLNLSSYSFDIDGDDMNWSVDLTQSNVNNLTILIDNNTGIVNISSDLNFFGIRWIYFNVSDNDDAFDISSNVTINITPINDAPYFNDTINNITFPEDTVFNSLNLNIYSYDVDDLDLNWTINHSLSILTNLTVGIDNSSGIVTITPDSNFSGIRNITFNVYDAQGLFNTSNLITINVTPVNDAPILNDTISNITFNEDTYFDTLNLTKYYFDIDGDDINWSVNLTLSNTNNLTITIDNNTGILNITPDLNFYGIRWMSINGYDPDNLFATSNNITINVTPVNDAPYFNDTINNITFPEDTVFNSLNLNIYSYDVDDSDLNWTINHSLSILTNLTVIINNNTGIVTITPDNNFTGIRNITFNVYDAQGLFDTSNLITINVTPVNDRPIFTSSLPNITFAEDTHNDTLNLSSYSFDIDGDDMNWSVDLTQSNVNNITILIDNNTGIVNLTSDLNFYGIRWVTFKVSDPSNTFDLSNNITINVTPVNDAPYFNDTISNITFAEDTTFNSLNLSIHSYDVDDLDLNWTVNHSLSILTNLTLTINNNTGIVTITPDNNFTGTRFLTLNVYDAQGLFGTSNLITINVTPVNDAPILNDTINNITFNEDAYDDLLNLTKYYFDIDGNDINWSVNSTLSNINNLVIDIDNTTGIINITPDLNFFGIRWMSINGYDPDNLFATSNNITINITPVNDAPVISSLPNITFNEDTFNDSLFFNPYVSDVDNLDSELNWTVINKTGNHIHVVINNLTKIANFTSDFNWYGSELFEFIVHDPSGLTDNYTINVTVISVNDAPIINPVVPNITLLEDFGVSSYNLTQYETDDNDVLQRLNWSISGVNVVLYTAIINTTTDNLTLYSQSNRNGIDNVTLTLTDNGGLTTTQNITITILPVNDAPNSFNLILPTNGTNTSDNTTFFDWQTAFDVDLDPLTYYLEIDNSVNFDTLDRRIETTQSNYTLTLLESLPDGVWNWRVEVCDNSGTANNCTYSTQNWSFRVDTNGPVIHLDDPDYNQTVGWNITFYNTITDDIAIVNVTYNITNSTGSVVKSGLLYEISSFDFWWNTNTLTPDGTYNLTIYAEDNLGNYNVNSTIFTIDNTDPSVQIVYPEFIYLNHNFSVLVDMHNEHLMNVSFNITNSTGSLMYSNSSNFSTTIKDYSFTDFINVNTWNDDNYTINAYANDEINNDRLDSSWFIVDKTKPQFQFLTRTADPIYHTQNVTINVSYTDQFGVAQVNISHNATGFWNNISATQVAPNVYQIVIDSGMLQNGEIIGFYARSVDLAGNVNSDMLIQNFTVQNRVSTISSIDFGRSTFRINEYQNCSAIIYDADNDTLSLEFKIWDSTRSYFVPNYFWDNSNITCNSTSYNQNVFCYVNVSSITGYKGNWSCSLLVVDGFDSALSYDINGSEMINTIPTVTNPNVNNTSPNVLSIIECNNGTFNDENLEDIQNATNWRWYKNNTLLPYTTKVLNLSSYWPGTFARSDNITCSENVFDGTDNSTWSNSSNYAMIINSISYITYINTTPYNNSLSTDDLYCNYTIFDADLDSDFAVIDWFVDNVSTGINNRTLKSTNTSDSEYWHCQVTPYDGINYGTPRNSSTVFIIGSRPDIISFVDNSNSTNPINVGDTLNITVDWYDLDQFGGGESVALFVCNSSNINSGGCADRTYCSVPMSSNDPTNCSFIAQQSDNTTMVYYVAVCDDSSTCSLINDTVKGLFEVNHRPVVDYAIVESSINNTHAYTNDTLICNYSYHDVDSDSVGITFNWYEYNGTQWNNLGIITENLSSINTIKHNKYLCEVYALDEHSFDNILNSTTNTILNRIPVFNISEQINLITYPEDGFNNTINLSAMFFDIDLDTIYWNINYANSNLQNVSVVYSNLTGMVMITSDLDFYGVRNVTFIASDLDINQSGWSTTNTIIINITPVNDVPIFIGLLPNITFAEDTYNDTLNLLSYSFDVDGDDMNWSIVTSQSNIENLTIIINNNTGIVNITSDLNFFGIRWVYFNISDPSGAYNISNNVTINVTPVNDAPYFNDTINNITFAEDTTFNSLNLTRFSYDVDDSDLNWTVNNGLSNLANLTLAINNATGIVTIVPDNNFTGLRFVTFTVWDSFSSIANSNLVIINVTPVNDRPIFTSSLPNITFAEDTYNDTLNLLSYSFDVDGDDMNWSIVTSQSNIENLTIIINNNTGIVNITSDLNFYGLRWVYFNVSDPNNTYDISTNVTINVTPVNDAPFFNDTIANITFPEDTTFNSLNLTRFSYDVDDSDLNWTVNNGLSNLANLTLTINNNTGIVTIVPDNNFTGLRFVTFTVWDSFSANANSNLITLNITPINDRPIFTSSLSNITFAEDTYNDTLNLLSYSFDVDGDDINWSIVTSQSNIENLTIIINNNTGIVNITSDLDFYGTRWIYFNVSDSSNTYDVSTNVTINVTPVNDAPFFNDTIANITFSEDTTFNSLNLTRFSYDVDDLDLNWTVNNGLSNLANLTLTINNNTGIVTIVPDNNFTGLRFVTFTVWDSFSANANSNLITLNITPVNDRPIFTSSLPNITFAEDTYNDTLNLLSYSFDVDGDDMNWSIVTSQSNIENLTIIINNNTGQVNITSDLDFYGIRWIYFNVSDPSNTYDISTNVTINVTPVNDPPYYTANIPTIIFPEDTIFNSLNLSNYTADVDDLDLNWTVNYGLSVINNLTININNATGIVTITPDGNFTGLRLVTFTVWDSFNSTANSNLITINVTPVNDPPTFITTINNVTFDEDTFNDSINLQSHFFDVDGDLLNWSINTSLSNITNLTINISSSGLVNITADLDWYGKRWVTFVAIDTYNEFAVSNNVSIEVFAVNDPPRQIAVIPDIVFPEDTVFRNMNLSDYFFDVEGSYINYTINTALSSIQNISFTIINTTGNITITPDGNFTNTRWIYFNAIDNESASTLSTRINIDVTPVNDPPASLAVMPNITVWENDFNTSITLDNYVWDVDNNDWELSWGFISSSGHLLGSVIWSGLTQIANISGQLEWNGYEPLVLNVCDFEYCRNTTIWVLVLGKDYPIISSYNLSNRTTSWWTFNDNFTTTATEVLQENSTIDFLMDITDNDFNDSMNLTWFVYDLFDNNFSGFYKLGNDSDKDMSITFDWHAAGDYLVRLVANDLLNHTSELTWNIFVRNKNRAPNKPTILFPPNNHFYTYNNTNWNWTLVTDPDDEAGKTAYDIYDISYRLIIANTTELIETMLNIDSDNLDTSINTSGNATIFVDRRFDNNTNNYTLIDPEQLPSGIYHAILIANDSRDFNYSDIVDFEVDLPPQVDIYRIFRNPAKIDFHNVTINWTAQDDNGIVDAYINVTNPDNTLLGQYRSSIKLLPINMTQNGTYTITAFAIDSKNSTALVTRNFSVVYDIWPPSIRLLNPRLYLLVPGVNATVGGTGTVIFDYNVTDLSPVDYCSLYLQSKFVTIMIPWSVFGNRTDIYDGLYGYKGLDVEGTGQTNRFVVSGLVRGDYTWNVYCIDDESNGGYSVYNGSFELDIPDATINIIEPELGTEVSQTIPRYGVELDVDKYEVNEDDIVTLKGKIRSTGEQLTSVELSTNVSWIILDETYIKTLSGEEDLVFFVNTNYVASGNHTVQFIVRSNEVSYKKAATIIVKGRKMAEVELPGINRLSLTKRIEIDGDNMIVKLIFKNVGYGEISKFSAVDELLNGKVINYDPKLMELDKFNRMVINVPALGLNSNYTVEYTAKDLNIDTLTKPIVSGNIYTIFDQEVNVPLEMNFVIQRTVIKERLLSSSLVLFILMILGIKLYAKKGGAI